MTACFRIIFAVLCAFGRSPSSWATETDAAQCEKAASFAEQQQGIPLGLLDAIGRVESGRPDVASCRVMAWPWTINALGSGKTFETQADGPGLLTSSHRSGPLTLDPPNISVTVLRQLPAWIDDYNECHPHSGLRICSPREFLRLSTSGHKAVLT